MTCVLVGERPPKRKNKYIFKDNLIFHACQQYGELNLIEYLYQNLYCLDIYFYNMN